MSANVGQRMPLVAILRGIEPVAASHVATVLVDAGFEIIEVPLNSPQPLESIATIAETVGNAALVGAGTVLDPTEVEAVAGVGGKLIVSPNCNPAVIRHSKALDLVSFPGVFTPSEMFTAIDAGADGLKLFPAELASPQAIKAMRAVLPRQMPLYVVGGVNAGDMSGYLAAGATGFGIGGSLFMPGKQLVEIARDAKALVAAFKRARSQC